MSIFHLIRHAERDTAPDLLPGRALGIALTVRGRAQAERIAERFRSAPLDHVYSSPLERAMATATPLALVKQLPVQVAPEFNEMDFGRWTGRRAGELEGDATWRAFNRFRSGTPIPGGESAAEVQARFVGGLLRLRESHPDQHIACVSHADPIRLALVFFLGAPIDCLDRLEIAVASTTVLQLEPWGACVLRLNDTGCT